MIFCLSSGLGLLTIEECEKGFVTSQLIMKSLFLLLANLIKLRFSKGFRQMKSDLADIQHLKTKNGFQSEMNKNSLSKTLHFPGIDVLWKWIARQVVLTYLLRFMTLIK